MDEGSEDLTGVDGPALGVEDWAKIEPESEDCAGLPAAASSSSTVASESTSDSSSSFATSG